MNETAVPAHITDLVDANQILFRQRILDAFGHVSIRDPDDPSMFHMSRNRAPALVTAADLQRLDLAGQPTDQRASYLERYIHSEIYRARADVKAIVHSHSAALLPFGTTRTPLRAIAHTAGFLGEGVPVFEISSHAGPDSDLLVRSPALGAALAGTLGEHAMVLMRGHGSVSVGATVQQAVYRAVFAEINGQAQAAALQIGAPRYLSAGECRAAADASDSQIGRVWDLWRAQSGR